ncbi:hypothetical protein [Actinoplanes sp. TFC3]|uniref:hypothetical protein n=1 Tax=Actinoplanes sp. TFC3 TaxID=1710355 RepID=UPI00082CFD21|nr:hypothetical protein [Actinoplanes sp. TFC3]
MDDAHQDRFAASLAGGNLPMMAGYLSEPGTEVSLYILMEFGQQRLLDGLAELMDQRADGWISERTAKLSARRWRCRR